jgi:molybdopterin-guanine dinucleotide biosynthesis protein A
LESFQSDIIVVSAKESSLPQLTQHPRLKIVNDILPGKGSLGGVYTGLTVSNSLNNLVVGCDMPFLNLDLLRYMVGLADDFDVIIPKGEDDILEPLHAVYSKNCIPTIQFLIEQNRLSILELYPMVRVRYVTKEEIDRIDPRHLSFFNINTEAELQVGKRLAGKEDFTDDKC